MGWVQVTPSVTLSNVTPLNIFKLDVNFDKSTMGYIIFVYSSCLQIFKIIRYQ